MLRRSPFQRTVAATVLALTVYVLGAGAFHLHPHGQPAAPGAQVSVPEEGAQDHGSRCPLCRVAHQPIAAPALEAGPGEPLTLPAFLETGLLQEPRHVAAAAARPRAPPAASSVS